MTAMNLEIQQYPLTNRQLEPKNESTKHSFLKISSNFNTDLRNFVSDNFIKIWRSKLHLIERYCCITEVVTTPFLLS